MDQMTRNSKQYLIFFELQERALAHFQWLIRKLFYEQRLSSCRNKDGISFMKREP
jgi:hypothetical protein